MRQRERGSALLLVGLRAGVSLQARSPHPSRDRDQDVDPPVDFGNQRRAEGVPTDEALRRAGETRFLPIVLTGVPAVVGGLLRLAIGGHALYAPLTGDHRRSDQLDGPARIVTPVLYRMLAPPVAASGT